MATRLHQAAFATVIAAVTGSVAAALILSGAAAAGKPTPAAPSSSTPGLSDGGSGKADPPLTSFASVPLSTASGTIQSVIYDGANTTTGGSLPLTLSGFTVPAAPFSANTTAVVADGQIAGNTFSFAGSGPAFNDPAAFPGTGPGPAGWSFGCLWDNRNYGVSSTLASGDSSATATVASSPNFGSGPARFPRRS